MLDTFYQICLISPVVGFLLIFGVIAIPVFAVYLFIKLDPFWLRKNKSSDQSAESE